MRLSRLRRVPEGLVLDHDDVHSRRRVQPDRDGRVRVREEIYQDRPSHRRYDPHDLSVLCAQSALDGSDRGGDVSRDVPVSGITTWRYTDGFRARTKALMNLSCTTGAMASTS